MDLQQFTDAPPNPWDEDKEQREASYRQGWRAAIELVERNEVGFLDVSKNYRTWRDLRDFAARCRRREKERSRPHQERVDFLRGFHQCLYQAFEIALWTDDTTEQQQLFEWFRLASQGFIESKDLDAWTPEADEFACYYKLAKKQKPSKDNCFEWESWRTGNPPLADPDDYDESPYRKFKQLITRQLQEESERGIYSVPGFISEVMNVTLATAPYPNRPLAFAGALSLTSLLLGRCVTFRGLSPNLYVLGLASSGSGKDQPRRVNVEILCTAGMEAVVGDAMASGQAVEDALFISPRMIFQTDEIDAMLASIANAKDLGQLKLSEMLLKLFSSASSRYFLRRKAGDEAPRTIDRPHLVLFGTSTPTGFWDSLNQKTVQNGLVPRMVVIEAGERGQGQRGGRIEIPESVLEFVHYWRDYMTEMEKVYPHPTELAIDWEAEKLLDAFRSECDVLYNVQQERQSEPGMAIVARCCEQATKLAMIFAASVNCLNPVITAQAVRWSTKFMREQTKTLLEAMETRIHENDFDKLCNRLLAKVRASHKGVNHSTLLKFSKHPKKEFDAAIQTLIERGDVIKSVESTLGRPRATYLAAKN